MILTISKWKHVKILSKELMFPFLRTHFERYIFFATTLKFRGKETVKNVNRIPFSIYLHSYYSLLIYFLKENSGQYFKHAKFHFALQNNFCVFQSKSLKIFKIDLMWTKQCKVIYKKKISFKIQKIKIIWYSMTWE